MTKLARILLLLGFGLALLPAAHAQFAIVAHGPLSGACYPHTLGLDSVDNVVYSCGDAVNGLPAQWAAIGGATACPACIQQVGGNASITGNFTMAELITNGGGAWQVVGLCGSLGVSPTGYLLLGADTGCLPAFSSSGGAVTLLAYQDGSGNVLQNALTASALAAVPTDCSGQYAIGISANGNAVCNTSTYVLIPEIAAPAGVSGYGEIWADSTAHLFKGNENNAGAVTFLTKNINYATWGPCPIGGTTATTQYCSWTPPAGITLISMDVAVNGLPAGCSTYAVISANNESTSTLISGFSITLGPNSANTFQNVTPTAQAFPSGNVLTFKVSTAAAGCSSNATNVVATVTYQIS
jgi:hypothetical protein